MNFRKLKLKLWALICLLRADQWAVMTYDASPKAKGRMSTSDMPLKRYVEIANACTEVVNDGVMQERAIDTVNSILGNQINN